MQVAGLSPMGLIAAGGYFSLTGPGEPVEVSTAYTYDRLYRLVGVDRVGEERSYGYDPAGNRSSRDSTSYGYDRADRITSAGGVSYTVDGAGNLISRGGDSFGYDGANRLKSASVTGTSSGYAYDGDGKRASKTVGSVTTGYTYDVNASLPVLLEDGERKYVWGLGLAYAVDSSGNVLVYHSDGLGSIRAITDGAGTVVQTYRYDEYGVPTESQGAVTQPFGYTGEQQDAETGLLYLRARMYEPRSGRFMSRDPFPGVMSGPTSLNRFSYVEGNPTSFTDPSGLCADPGGAGLRYCIERYIPAQSVLSFAGDNRGPNSDGGSYRIQQLISWTANGELTHSVKSDDTILLNPFDGKEVRRGQGTPHGVAKARVLEDGSRIVAAYSTGSQGVIPAPPVTTNVVIREAGGKAQVIYKYGTMYPALDVWMYGGADGPQHIYSYPGDRETVLSLVEPAHPLP